MIGLCHREIIGRAARLAAQAFEAEHADALEAARHVQQPPATNVEIGRGNIGGILGRIVGEAVEGLAHLRGGGIAQRGVPGGNAREARQAVIDRAIQWQHIERTLDQRDEGQEMLAVEAILVEIARGAVGGGDDGEALIAHHRGKQAAHDHRVGGIVDHHFIEGEHPQPLCQNGGHSPADIHFTMMPVPHSAVVSFGMNYRQRGATGRNCW